MNGRFHVTFSLRWTVGHRFRSNFNRAFGNRKKVISQNLSSKKIFLAFLRLFYFSLSFYSNKNFFLQLLHQMLKSIEKNFQKYIIDVTFLKESIPGVKLATQGFPNLKFRKSRCQKFHECKSNKNERKSKYYFLSYQTRNSKKTSNSHISGSSGPKISIRRPNSRSWCQLSDGPNRVMFLTILTLVLAGNLNALLLGLENRLKTKVFTCIKKITKMRLMRYRMMKKNGFLAFLG